MPLSRPWRLRRFTPAALALLLLLLLCLATTMARSAHVAGLTGCSILGLLTKGLAGRSFVIKALRAS